MRTITSISVVLVLLLAAAAPLRAQERQLERAERELRALDERLERARRAYVGARQRVGALYAELGEIQARLERARAAEAVEREQLAYERRRAEEAMTRLRAHRDALARRASHIYKHGVPDLATVLTAEVDTSLTVHDVTMATMAARQLLRRDQRLLEQTRVETVRARAAEERAQAAARRASDQRERVEGLTDEHRRLVAQADRERAASQRIVEELAADRRAVQALIDRLRRVSGSVEAVLREPIELPFDQPGPGWSDGLPAAGHRWAGAVDAAAARSGLRGRFFAALVWTESSFRPDARSSAGAIGLAQLMPATAAALGVDARDPHQNLTGGARYLRSQLDRFWDLELALAAYHQGPTRVADARSASELVASRLYVLTVLERWRQLTG